MKFPFPATLAILVLVLAFNARAQTQTTESSQSITKQITAACKLPANTEHPECIKRAAAKQRAAERKAAKVAGILQSMAR